MNTVLNHPWIYNGETKKLGLGGKLLLADLASIILISALAIICGAIISPYAYAGLLLPAVWAGFALYRLNQFSKYIAATASPSTNSATNESDFISSSDDDYEEDEDDDDDYEDEDDDEDEDNQQRQQDPDAGFDK